MPQYVQMYHKPDACFEIQDTFCGRIIVMLKLKLVKGKTADEADATSNGTATSGG